MRTKLSCMKKLNTISKSFLLLIAGACYTLPLVAQDAAATPSTPSFTIDVNTLLIIVSAILFCVILALGYTLQASLQLYKKKKQEEKKSAAQTIKTVLTIIVCMGVLQVSGQDATPALADNPFSDAKIFRYLLYGFIFLELIIIFAMVYWIRFFTGIADLEKEKAAERRKKFKGVPSWWARANKLKPIEEEDSLDVGHSYDGIRELDNVTPPWFTIAFIASIVFGLGYLWRYQVARSAPNQYEEYEISVTKAELAKQAYLASKGDAVDENTVTMLDAAGIEAGKTLFTNNCTACHGSVGQGGVGPNLTDDYWLHGGSIGDVFKVIKVGVVEKGMMSWKDIFSPEQIAELASYIKSIHGTNPPDAKEKQGELYKEQATVADSSAAPAATDGTAAKL